MNTLEKLAIRSLRNTLKRKADDAQTRSHEANWKNNQPEAAFFDGLVRGYLCSIVELDTMLNILEKE